jgi:hypothetical protein
MAQLPVIVYCGEWNSNMQFVNTCNNLTRRTVYNASNTCNRALQGPVVSNELTLIALFNDSSLQSASHYGSTAYNSNFMMSLTIQQNKIYNITGVNKSTSVYTTNIQYCTIKNYATKMYWGVAV